MQYMPVCAKMIFSWVRKVTGIAKAHMPSGTLCVAWCEQLWGWCFPGVHHAG